MKMGKMGLPIKLFEEKINPQIIYIKREGERERERKRKEERERHRSEEGGGKGITHEAIFLSL